VAAALLATAATSRAQPTAADWTALAKLPDWSGVWIPDVADQRRQERDEHPPWTPAAQAQIDFLFAEDEAGRPKLILDHCLPHGMPSWMLITHNALEILATPGRVTMLGEGDGNRIRRIYTDGRPHPSDPDLTMHGHSTAKWEGDTLVVDTVGVAPQSYIALSEGVGIPNNGGMHIVERIRLRDPDTMAVELAITAPKVLADTWTTTRLFARRRGARFDIVEGQCVQGALVEAEVVEFRWVNPHSYLTVVDTRDASREATLADGKVLNYNVELPTTE
jgi:hypothetical protein